MNKTVLITGATSGFGRAIAYKFAQNGYDLVITGRRDERLNDIKTELERQYAVKVTPLVFDVRDRIQTQNALGNLKDQLQVVDILVNNAGLAAGLAPIDEGNVDDWDTMIDTNVKGLLYVTKQVLPFIKNSKAGHIINISSTAAKTVYKNGNVYCASKFAVEALTQSMRIDLLQYGIKVTSVDPGMAETEFSLVRFKGDKERADNVYKDFKPLSAEDVADVVYYTATLPPHVCINDVVITCLNQANSFYNVKDIDMVKGNN